MSILFWEQHGIQMGGWFKKPVEKLADLKGLKMRIPVLVRKSSLNLGEYGHDGRRRDLFGFRAKCH
jgi:TRAP-type mannitol/chloroaromatic compound transport system substrate-binding protein